MVTYIVTGIVLVAVLGALISGMWKASKYLVIPTQILIFLALIFIVIKVFFNKENVKTLNSEIEKSGIVETQKNTAKNIMENGKISFGGQSQQPSAESQSAAVSAAPQNEKQFQGEGTQGSLAPEKPAKTEKNKTDDLVDLL